MRKEGGMEAINAAIERLSKTHPEHISQYGTGNELRLTGKHETCDMNTFRSVLPTSPPLTLLVLQNSHCTMLDAVSDCHQAWMDLLMTWICL